MECKNRMFIQISNHPISLLILWVMSSCVILESAYRLAVKIMVCVWVTGNFSPAGYLNDQDLHWLKCLYGGELAQVSSQPHVYTMLLQPERIVGEEYGLHSDIWSLGVTLFEVCC